jgi:predicted Zn-dependent peptidase
LSRPSSTPTLRPVGVTLPSGLPLAIAPLPHLHRAAISFVLKIGARYETPETSGLSHFLEHMLHRGTDVHPSAHAQAVALEGLGASLDATTGVDHGTFTLSVPPENFAEATLLLGQALLRPAFSDLEVERGIVREELAEERDGRGKLVDPDGVARGLLFGDHALGFPIVGTARTLKSFRRRDLEQHHARHYTVKNAAVGVSGRLPPKREIVAAVSAAFADLPRGPAVRSKRFAGPTRGPALRVVRTPSHQIGVRVALLGPGRGARDAAAAELLLRLIDDGTSTRLYERLCDKNGLCYDVSAGYEPYDDVGLFDVAAEATEDGALRALEEILALLSELQEHGPTEDELTKAKQRARYHAERSFDQAEGAAEQAATALIAEAPATLADHHRRLFAVPSADVARVARRMIARGRIAIALVGPVSRGAEKRARELAQPFEA